MNLRYNQVNMCTDTNGVNRKAEKVFQVFTKRLFDPTRKFQRTVRSSKQVKALLHVVSLKRQ